MRTLTGAPELAQYSLTFTVEYPFKLINNLFITFLSSKRKINDFLTILEGFNKATEIVSLFKDHVSSFRYMKYNDGS